MSVHSEIEDTLRRLGGAEPPIGLERRIHRRLQTAPRRFSVSLIYAVSGGALAASVAASAVILNPTLHRLVFPHPATIQNLGSATTPRVIPVAPGFGAASVVHVPAQPVPVQPTPINQGRGRSRSGRATLPSGSVAPLPRGVAHGQPLAPTGTGDR